MSQTQAPLPPQSQTLTQSGHFTTPKASQYLQQLCKHFGHKTEVSFNETRGQVHLSAGAVQLRAEDGRLWADLSGADAKALATGRDVIDRHLVRFAFREGFETMDWAAPQTA